MTEAPGIVQQLRPTTPAGRESNAARDLHQRLVEGRQPAALTATTLMHDTRLPVAWAAQRARLGFASPSGHDGEPRGHPGEASQPGVGGGDARA